MNPVSNRSDQEIQREITKLLNEMKGRRDLIGKYEREAIGRRIDELKKELQAKRRFLGTKM